MSQVNSKYAKVCFSTDYWQLNGSLPQIMLQKLRQKLGISERLKTVYKTGYRLEI